MSGPAGVNVGETITLTAAVEPADAESYTLAWSVDEESIATIDPKTGVLTGVAAGSAGAVCTAQNSDGSNVASEAHAVTVTAPE
ncbi:Ig-like domain-containing protein [Cronobacter sakazakii]|nr:Ig-like domain-containing protein [Cronobacter sakazakii]ELY3593809.1 Ig-like domain-containing protein [Cronobacter sakazakii]ELY3605954.1 Ig-like domain-containing protein [Cronobacter sakazakii]